MMKSWALNQIIALNHHNESLDLGPKSTLSLQRSESPRNPTSMAGPTSHTDVETGVELVRNIRCEN